MSNEVKEGYKEVRIGPKKKIIPKEWEVKSLSDVANFINGKGFSSSDWEEEGIPIVRIQNLNDPDADYNYYSGEVKDKYVLEDGDILLSWSASLGAYKWQRGKAFLNQHIFKVEPTNANKEFLYNTLIRSIEKLTQKTHGSTMKHIRKKDLDLTYFPCPPLPEQKKIADILSSVDQAIEKTDQIIAKNQELKKGLMQELLTKGIGHDEFKEVRIGVKEVKVPVEWEVKNLGEISTVKRGASPRPISDPKWFDNNSNVGWVRISDITRTGKYLTNTEQYLSKQGIEKSRFANEGTLILSICATVGKPSILSIDACLHDGLVGFFDIESNISTEYLYYVLLKNRETLKAKRQTGTQSNLNSSLVRRIEIPLPPLEEQKKIANILSSVDNKIQKKQEQKEKLEELKKGLMQKLLTGEVRVDVEE